MKLPINKFTVLTSFLTVLVFYSSVLATPQISLESPAQNEMIREKEVFLVKGELRDPRGLKSVTFLLNGIPLEKHTTRGLIVVENSITRFRNLNGTDVWPFEIKIPRRALENGKNTLKLVAINLAEQHSDFERHFDYEPPKSDIYVVSIGINRYQSSKIPQLKYAENDAKAFANYFSEEIGLPESRVILLTGKNASQRNIKWILGTKLKKLAQAKDQIILFFAGHGAPEPEQIAGNTDGLEKYLLPYDASLESLYATAIPMREIEYLIQRFSSKRVVIVLDTCFSGQVGMNARTISYQTLGLRSGIISSDFYNRLAKGKGKMILTASAANQVSHELNKYKHGAFTHFVLEALKGKGDNDHDGIITVNEVFQYVSQAVPKVTQQNQYPQLFGGGGDVVLGRSSQMEVAMVLPDTKLNGGRIIIEVSPPEANILIDGADRGLGPILNTVLSEGNHSIRVRMKSFVAKEKRITIGKDSLSQLKFSLSKTADDDFALPPP